MPGKNPDSQQLFLSSKNKQSQTVSLLIINMRRRTHASQSDDEKDGPGMTPPSSGSDEYLSDGDVGTPGSAANVGEVGAAKPADKPKRTLLVRKRGGGAPATTSNGSAPASPVVAPASADAAATKHQGRRAQHPRSSFKKKERNQVPIHQ